jgi:hypothetical protein
MIVKIPKHIYLEPHEIAKLRELVNSKQLKITKSYLSKIINEKVSIPEKTWKYLFTKI